MLLRATLIAAAIATTTRRVLVLASMGVVATAAIVEAPHAKADPPPNCNVAPWGILRLKTRIICDGPIQPDGSWMRHRIIGIPAHYENPSSSCSSGEYYSNCTYYPGGWVDDQISDNETYPVTAGTVLPDEPGHMPNPAPGPAPAAGA
jgi:hypothetical protein